jgi:hypothetical protein
VYVLSFCPRFRVPETKNEKMPQSRDICAARVVSKLICYLDFCARRLFFSSLLKSRHIHSLCSLFACALLPQNLLWFLFILGGCTKTEQNETLWVEKGRWIRNDRDPKFMCFPGFLKSESCWEMCARCLLGLGNVTQEMSKKTTHEWGRALGKRTQDLSFISVPVSVPVFVHLST